MDLTWVSVISLLFASRGKESVLRKLSRHSAVDALVLVKEIAFRES
jgi:hypothetical protein